jgi:hypothetical protein
MALVFTRLPPNQQRYDQGRVATEITLDTAYPAGGYPITPKELGLISAPSYVESEISTAQGFESQWDYANSKLKFYEVGAAGAFDEADAADLSASIKCRVVAYGDPIF